MFNLTKLTSENPLPSPPGDASFSYMLIDATLALVALVVGFLSALLYFRHTSARSSADTDDPDARLADAEKAVDRANMAALQLGDLAKGMASDVSSHSELMGKIADRLKGNAKPNTDEDVLTAVEQIVEANGSLQKQLADAEEKIQAQAEEIRSQQSEARTDSLTGLHNRRAFDAALEECQNRFRENATPVSLLMLDVDHFKKLNDQHGHQAGDEVLQAVGETLKSVLKQNDFPCRYGGEEFAIVMPNTTAQHGRVAAGRVRKAIELMTVQYHGQSLSVTASVGVAEMQPGDDAVLLIRRADDAVYASKKAGRNCGHWHNGDACLPLSTSRPETPTNIASGPGDANVLAGLPDRSVFSSELRRRISESHRFGVPLSIMFLRVKDHPQLVETYGEAVGELVLESVVAFIQSALRDMDLLGVYDAGEFIVMLPGSSELEATQVGRRLRTAISQCELPLGESNLKLAMFHGVTDVQPNDDAQSMINRAIELAAADAEQAALAV